MIIERQEDVTPAVLKELERAPNARFKEIVGAFVRHMHDFVRESKITEEEFRTALNYVVALGKAIARRKERKGSQPVSEAQPNRPS